MYCCSKPDIFILTCTPGRCRPEPQNKYMYFFKTALRKNSSKYVGKLQIAFCASRGSCQKSDYCLQQCLSSLWPCSLSLLKTNSSRIQQDLQEYHPALDGQIALWVRWATCCANLHWRFNIYVYIKQLTGLYTGTDRPVVLQYLVKYRVCTMYPITTMQNTDGWLGSVHARAEKEEYSVCFPAVQVM